MTSQKTDSQPLLAALEAELEQLNDKAQLKVVDDYLKEYPGDSGALLLRAELLLRLESDYADIGRIAVALAPRLEGSPRFGRLQTEIDETVRAKLREGRLFIGRSYYGDSALQALEDAVNLAYQDPSVAMAAALIALDDDKDGADDRFCSFNCSSSRQELASRYFQTAITSSSPDSHLARRAALYRLRIALAQKNVHVALEQLQQMPALTDTLATMADAFASCVTRVAFERARLLLQMGECASADELLDLCAQFNPPLPNLHMLRAESARLRDQPAEACDHYRAALVETTPMSGYEQALVIPLLTRMTEFATVCAECGKRTPADKSFCAYCGRSLVQHELWITRHSLDTKPSDVVARIGLGLLLMEAGEGEAGEQHFAAGIAEVTDEEFRAELLALRPQRADAAPLVAESQRPPLAERWLRGGLSADVVAELRAGPEIDWTALSERQRCTLIRSTLALNDSALTRRLWNAAFVEPPQTKAAQTLHKTLLRRDGQQANAWFTAAETALAGGDRTKALEILDAALALVPPHPQARLLRGQLRLQAGSHLSALADLEVAAASSSEAATTARVAAARILERLGDFPRALALLEKADPDEATQALRARLVRRHHVEPYVRLSHAGDMVMHDTLRRSESAQVEGVFAIALRMTGRAVSGAGDSWFQHLMTANYEFVQSLGALRDSAGDPVFALRWISQPHATISERGQLTFAILVRVTASDADLCHAHALELWSALRPMLPGAQAHMYSFEPVMDEAELEHLLRPFEPVTLAEVVRREETPKVGGNRYTVYPFMPGSPHLHTLCWALLRQPGPAMLSVHLVPTSLQPWEEARFDRIMHESDNGDSLDPNNAPVTYNDPVSRWWQGAPQWGQAQANRHLVDYLRSQAYILRVNVATGPQTPSVLPDIIASTLFGPVRPVQNALYGGYEVVRALTDTEQAIARRNLQTVDVEGWVYSAAPAAASRLRHLVSESEAVLAFRLPIPAQEGLPGVAVMDVKPVAPPPDLPLSGTMLGESVARVAGVPLLVYQSDDDRRRHTYIVGKTGVGKSTLLKTMALQDMEAGHGVCVIDPHGDLIDELLGYIPLERIEDVILFDPSDVERPIGLNLLEAASDTERYQIVNEFIGLLVRMYDPHEQGIVGPRFQHNVRNAMLTAMAIEGNTLIEVVRVLTDSDYVTQLLPHVTDPVVKNYWEKQIANTSDFHKSEILDYIVSKFSRFVGDALVRNIIGQSRTTLDFRGIMDQRKILLVNLSKGRIGPENAQFLGLLLVQRLLLTALSRADARPENRPDFYLYVDEFQNFATDLFGTVLSEGRKYGVAATVANQYLTQLDKKVFEAVSGNVGSLICFRLGTQDALTLASEVYPVFDHDDLLNLPKYTACVKLLANGISARPFTMRTRLDVRTSDLHRADAVRARSRAVFGRDVREVNEQVLARIASKK